MTVLCAESGAAAAAGAAAGAGTPATAADHGGDADIGRQPDRDLPGPGGAAHPRPGRPHTAGQSGIFRGMEKYCNGILFLILN